MPRQDRYRRIAAWAAILFGLLTILSGSSVLFGPDGIRNAAGEVVPAILWFNALSGFAYIAAGAGLLAGTWWARPLAGLIALAIAAMLLLLVTKILAGTPWEPRTLAAMILRLAMWIAITAIAPKHPRPVRRG